MDFHTGRVIDDNFVFWKNRTMIKLESLAAFSAIAASASFTAAARQLAVSKSVVSERLTELERTLGAKLLQRTTRRVALTEEGAVFYERAKRILRDVELAASELAERRGALAGPLRISAPVSFGSLHLGPALFGFLAMNPAIELTLDLEDRFVDVLNEGYDAVLRHGPVHDKRVIVKHLADSRRVLVASPAYLKRRGKPSSPEELKQHRGIIYSLRGPADWRFRTGRRFTTVQPRTAVRLNNGLLMRDAAVAGLGIALLPTFLLEAPLRERTLRVVDVGAEAEGAKIYLGYPEHLRSSARIRALAGWLQHSFGDPAYWDKARLVRSTEASVPA
jgi:DNA-binding transcriptional LysR family regulator